MPYKLHYKPSATFKWDDLLFPPQILNIKIKKIENCSVLQNSRNLYGFVYINFVFYYIIAYQY